MNSPCFTTNRPSVQLLALTAAIFLYGLLPALHAQHSPLPAQVAPQVDDATLADVMFVDRLSGWAVGNHGAIWHTSDGGKEWQLQASGVDANLTGVWFVDRQHGWAVGGETRPHSWNTQAIVLTTKDGGKSWQKLTTLLPALTWVRFFDKDQGVALAQGSSGEPLGVFSSADGGRNWQAVGQGPQSVWLGGDFVDARNGVAVGVDGTAVQLMGEEAFAAAPIDTAGRNLRSVKLLPPQAGWLVGDGGLVMNTDNAGRNWQMVEVLPAQLASSIDWHSIAMVGNKLWIVGNPGSVLLHSPDGGETWEGHATGITTPLSAVTFVDEYHGWAVGSLGAILHTDDGGQSWQLQRRGGERVAVLNIVTDPQSMPLETLAKVARYDGYRTATHAVFARRGGRQSHSQAIERRLGEVSTLMGANHSTLAWQFQRPLGLLNLTPEQEVAEIDRLSDGRLRERMLADFVRQIRQWRPTVVVVPSGNHAPGGPEALVESIALEAIDAAADPTSQVHLATSLALPPWQVSRVFATLSEGRGTHRVRSDEVVPRTGKSLGELATAARGLVEPKFSPPPESNELVLIANNSDGDLAVGRGDLLAGLGITPGSAARRAMTPGDGDFDLETARRLAEQRRNLAKIFRTSEGNPALLAQVGQLSEGMDQDAAANLLVELANQFREQGRMTLAADTLELLARRHPNHPLTDDALVWLVQFYASGEAAHAYRTGAQSETGNIQQTLARETDLPTDVEPATALSVTQNTLHASGTTRNLSGGDRLDRALQLAEHIARTRPLLYADPEVRVPWAIAARQRDVSTAADRYLLSLSLRSESDAWQQCASAENWLRKPDGLPPEKPVLRCRRAPHKPHLDGRLDEVLWEEPVGRLRLPANFAGERLPHAEIFLAYDDEFLYLAVRCKRVAGLDYATDDRPRPYDGDLSEHDRVRLYLDVDRDYLSYFQLAVDHRGWTNDACWQDTTWNPQWFVAARQGEDEWTVEAAIPWRELAPQAPASGTVWALAAERVAPTVAVQTLVGEPTEAPRPGNFGLLVFE